MAWQGYLRKLSASGKYGNIAVSSRSGHEYLYEDFASAFFPHDPQNKETDQWMLHGDSAKKPAGSEGYDIWIKPKKLSDAPQQFITFGDIDENSGYDVVYHARQTTKCGSANRNWPMSRWDEVSEVVNMCGYTSCSIGSANGASHVAGSEDRRGISLKELCTVLRNSKATIGPSSGPMHLASLCGCQHIVWTDCKHEPVLGYTNRDRYEKLWNPLNTRAIVIDAREWQPSSSDVVPILLDILKE